MTATALPYSHPSSAETAAAASFEFDTSVLDALAVDINVTAFTGGTTPSITFFVERQSPTGSWFQVWTSGALTAATVIALDLGPHSLVYAYPATQAAHAIFTQTARFRWAFGGAVSPTSVTFEAGVTGRRKPQ